MIKMLKLVQSIVLVSYKGYNICCYHKCRNDLHRLLHMLKQAEDIKNELNNFLKLMLYNELLLQVSLLNCLGVFQQDSKEHIQDAN